MIQTTVDKETGIIWSIVRGVITKEVLINKMIEIRFAAGHNTTSIKVMNIFEDASTELTGEEIREVWTLVAQNSSHLTKIKGAMIASTPRETALSMIYADTANKSEAFNIKVFSTAAAALKWLNEG
jgi:hypothetical protein